MFSSRIQVLTVERTQTKFPAADGTPQMRVAARCILLGDGGEVVTVGRLRVPKALHDKVAPGVFRATFALTVPDYGDSKGDIVASVTELVEEKSPARTAAAPAAPLKA